MYTTNDQYETTLGKQTWHAGQEDALLRQRVVVHLYRILGSNSAPSLEATELLMLCCRLERQLYHAGASREEYQDLNTMKRRLKGLAYMLYDTSTSRKRQRSPPQVLGPALKKQRRRGSEFLLNNNGDLISHIYSFLGMKEKIQHQQVNLFAYQLLPFTIEHLQVEVGEIRQLNFSRYPRLRDLDVYNKASKKDSSCATLPIRTIDRGEDAVVGLAAAIEAGQLKSLVHLSMRKCFINSNEINSFKVLINALQSGQSPALMSLILPGNCGGDAATVQIAELLTSSACPNLTLMDLRYNFIGEEGGNALGRALADRNCCNIQELELCGNILTDSTIQKISQALLQRPPGKQQFKFIGLQDNFISTETMHQLIDTVASHNIVLVNHHDDPRKA